MILKCLRLVIMVSWLKAFENRIYYSGFDVFVLTKTRVLLFLYYYYYYWDRRLKYICCFFIFSFIIIPVVTRRTQYFTYPVYISRNPIRYANNTKTLLRRPIRFYNILQDFSVLIPDLLGGVSRQSIDFPMSEFRSFLDVVSYSNINHTSQIGDSVSITTRSSGKVKSFFCREI